MVTVYASKTTMIRLGRAGENDHTQVIFDTVVQQWIAEYPSAVIGLYNRPHGHEQAYPVANIQQTGGTVIWTVKSADTSVEGRGQCELVAIAGETIVKSAIYDTNVLPALDGSATPPAPWEEWQAVFIEMKDDAEAAADRAEQAAVHSPMIQDGIWQVWDEQSGEYVSTGIEAQGPQGEPGPQGLAFTFEDDGTGLILKPIEQEV